MLLRLRQPIIIFVAGFLTLFLLRLGYSLWSETRGPVAIRQGSTFDAMSWEFGKGIKNYASYKRKRSVSVQSPGAAAGAGQKYEKIANIGLRSEEFDEDETRIRRLIGESDALIQFEQRQGLKGYRTLQLAIGVDPDAFDVFVDKVQTFGELTRPPSTSPTKPTSTAICRPNAGHLKRLARPSPCSSSATAKSAP